MNETEPKKMVSRNFAIALGLVCILLIAGISIVTVMLSRSVSKNSQLTQEFNREETLVNVWNSSDVPDNIGGLFQNRVILCENRNLTYPLPHDFFRFTNFTLAYNFTQTGCILINISYSNVSDCLEGIGWTAILPPFYYYSGNLNSTSGLFPVVYTNSVQITVGTFGYGQGNGAALQTVTVTYYY